MADNDEILAATPHAESAAFDAFPVGEQPLPGFEPLRVLDGPPTAVACWNRRYQLGATGLLEAVTSGGRQVLAAPVRLSGQIEGRALELTPQGQRLVEISARRVASESEARCGDVRWQARTRIDYDGLVRFAIDLTARQPMSLRDLCLEIPLRADSVRYLDYVGDFPHFNCGTRMLPATDGRLWESDQARHGDHGAQSARLVNTFVPYVWLGDSRGGLCFVAESDIGWQDAPGRSIIEIERAGDTVILRVHLVMGEARRQSFTVHVGLQATPVKPLPSGWRGWRFSNPGALTDDESASARATRKTVFAGMGLVGDVAYQHTRHPFLPDKLRAEVERAHDAGFEYVTYLCVDLLSDARPGLTETALLDMVKVPRLSRPWLHSEDPSDQHHKVCNWSPTSLGMILETVDDLVGTHDVDGIYLDNAFLISGCLRAGCSYQRPDGQRQPEFAFDRARAFYEKLANIFMRHGKPPFIWIHASRTFAIPMFSFATCLMDGELLMVDGFRKDHLDMADEAMGAVRLSGHALGLPALCYSDLKYENGYLKRHPDPQLSKAGFVERYGNAHIAVCLLYDSLFAGIRDREYTRRVTAVRDDFGIAADDVTFVPFWAADAVRAVDDRVKVSCYVRPDSVLLAAANLADDDIDATLDLGSAILGRCGPEGTLRDPLEDAQIPVRGGRATVRVPAHSFRLLLA